MSSPDGRTWPVTPDDTTDWETVFENPETGFIPLIAMAHSPEVLKQTTLVVIRKLFSRKNDESNFETFAAVLDEIVADVAPASDIDAMRADVIELLRLIKQERQQKAAAFQARRKAGEEGERRTVEDGEEPGDGSSAAEIKEEQKRKEDKERKIDQANHEHHQRRRSRIQAKKKVAFHEKKAKKELAEQNAIKQQENDLKRAAERKAAERKRRRAQFKLFVKRTIKFLIPFINLVFIFALIYGVVTYWPVFVTFIRLL